MNGAANILTLEAVTKMFREPAGILRVLDAVSFHVSPGEIVLLQGPSGSGKTTLLQIAGCLLRADSGRVALAGRECSNATEAERTAVRQKHLGFAFQHFHLIDGFEVEAVAYTSDIPLLDRWGTPLLFGPGSIHVAHTPIEYISVTELEASVAAYEQIIRALLA